MPGLESLLSNPRRLRQFASTPGNYETALRFASGGSVARRPSTRSRASAKPEGVLETGEVIDTIQLPDGSLAKPPTESGTLVKVPGKSNLYADPATGEPYQADPTKPTGLRSAYESARRVAKDGKLYAVVPGIGERELGPDPAAAKKAAEAEQKRQFEDQRINMARERRPYDIDRVTGQPLPRQTDEEWAKLRQEKADKLIQDAQVKKLRADAERLDIDARILRETAPKISKEDEDAYNLAREEIASLAQGEDPDTAAERLAAGPAEDGAAATARNYLSVRDRVKPAQEAEAKAKEMTIRALDLKKQMLDPEGWKAAKAASLSSLDDASLVAEAEAQAEILAKQEKDGTEKAAVIEQGRKALMDKLEGFNSLRREKYVTGITAAELRALQDEESQIIAEIEEYDDQHAEAGAAAAASLKAAADRKEVLNLAATEIAARQASQKQTAEQAKAKAAVMQKGRALYENWGKNLYSEDWRAEEETPRFAQEAAKAGLSLPEAKEALQTFRQLDWSNTRRDPKTAKPIEETARVLPDGNVTVNPTMWGDAEAYKKAVESSQGTPEGKAKALEAFPKLQEIHAEKAVEILSQSANIPGADNFMAWRERKIEEDQATQGRLGFARQSPAKQAIAYMEEMKNRSWFRKAGEQVAMGLLAGFQDIATQAMGVAGIVTGSETIADLAAENAANTESLVSAQNLEGSDTDYALRVMGMGARMTPAVAAMIAGAGAVGGGLGTAAILAGGQTAGSMFADLYRTAKDEAGLSHGEAWKKAALPAALAGTITGLLTKGMGATGLERVFSDTATQETARNTFKAMLGQFVKGAAEELPEEIADEYFTTVLQESAASADPVATFKNFAATLPELAGVTALMGGAGALMQARRQASGQEPGMAPEPEPAPEGEAPAMPEQPGLTAAEPATPENISRAIANFTPSGVPMPQVVNDTVERTKRAPDAVAKAAAAGLVKIAKGASLESLDAREREALGFTNKDGKIVPANKTTPLVDIYKGQLVIRNEAAEWLDDEGQPLLARQIRLDEAERKAQIDEAEAKPATKKKAGQAPAAKPESTPKGGPTAKTPDSLSGDESSTLSPATIPTSEPVPPTPTPAPAQTTPAQAEATSADPAEIHRKRNAESDAFYVRDSNGFTDRKATQEVREAAAKAAGMTREDWEYEQAALNVKAKEDFFAELNEGDTLEWIDLNGRKSTGVVEIGLDGKKGVRNTTEESPAEGEVYGAQSGIFGQVADTLKVTKAAPRRRAAKQKETPTPANEPETVQLPIEQPQGQVPEVVPVVPEQPPAQAPQAAPEPEPAGQPVADTRPTPAEALAAAEAERLASEQASAARAAAEEAKAAEEAAARAAKMEAMKAQPAVTEQKNTAETEKSSGQRDTSKPEIPAELKEKGVLGFVAKSKDANTFDKWLVDQGVSDVQINPEKGDGGAGYLYLDRGTEKAGQFSWSPKSRMGVDARLVFKLPDGRNVVWLIETQSIYEVDPAKIDPNPYFKEEMAFEKPPEQMSPDEAWADEQAVMGSYASKEDTRMVHEMDVNTAVGKNKPVSAAAVDAYKITLPEGYVRQGDLYVFQPTTPPAQTAEVGLGMEEPTQTVERDVTKPEPEQMTPEEQAALKLSKRKGVEDRGDGIFFIPERLVTPEIRKAIKRGGRSVEFKPWADVTGVPSDRGYAVLDRRARQASRKPQPTTPPAQTAEVGLEMEETPKTGMQRRQEALDVGLDRRTADAIGAFTDIAAMMREVQNRTPEQIKKDWLGYLEADLERFKGSAPRKAPESSLFADGQYVRYEKQKDGGFKVVADDATWVPEGEKANPQFKKGKVIREFPNAEALFEYVRSESAKEETPARVPLLTKLGNGWKLNGTTVSKDGFGHWTEAQRDEVRAVFREAGIRTNTSTPSGSGNRKSSFTIPSDDARRIQDEIFAEEVKLREAKKEQAKTDEAAKQAEELSRVDPAAKQWMDSLFGREDFANPANKVHLSDFVTGKTTKFGGMVNPKWFEGAQSAGAVLEGGKVDFQKLKENFEKSLPASDFGSANTLVTKEAIHAPEASRGDLTETGGAVAGEEVTVPETGKYSVYKSGNRWLIQQSEAKGDLAKAISRGAVIVSEDAKFVITEKTGIRDNKIYFAYAKDSGDELVGGQPFESLARARAFMGMEPTKEEAQPAQPPATPLAKAKAALTAYTDKVKADLKGVTGQKERAPYLRKLLGAEWLAKRLEAFDEAIEYEVATEDAGRPIEGMMVKQTLKGGMLVINPEGLIDLLSKSNLGKDAMYKAIDKYLVHEFIHKAALTRLTKRRIMGLYEAITPEAKAASRRLYLAQAGAEQTALDEFQAAHEWFAQLVEARMSGEISNQALIEASEDPTFRDKLAALFREFVAALRDIAGLVKDPAMAEQIRAEADAVEAIVADMAAKAGLEIQPKAEEPQVGVPRFDGDPNIGREWNSPAGRQRIISVEKWGGRDNYTVKTLETGGERIYDAPRLEESIKRDEYETTPEYAAEKAERKARAERQAAAEKASAEAAALAAVQVNSYYDDIGLSPMQKGKMKAALDQVVTKSSQNKTYTGPRYTVVEQMLADGYQPKVEQVPAFKELTRTQINRMDNRQAAEYERKRQAAGTKTEYSLETADGGGYVVTKAEHDYAKWLQAKAGLELGRAEGGQVEAKPMGQAAAAATITKEQAEEVLKDSTLKDRPIKTYEMAVAANQVHMGTKISDWSAFPFTGEAQDGRPTQNLAGASEMQKAPTLFPTSNSQDHGNCEWCGKQPVKNFYHIKNDRKKWTLAVGSECITHFADQSGDEMASEARQSLALATIQGIAEARKTLSKEFSEVQPAGYGRTERVWRSPPAKTLTDEAPDILGKITIESGAAAHSRWLNTKLDAAREWLARYAELMARPETKKRQIEWRTRRIKEIETTLKLKNKPEWELTSLEKKLEELRSEKATMEGTTATPPAVPPAADEIASRQRLEAARIKADDATAKREAITQPRPAPAPPAVPEAMAAKAGLEIQPKAEEPQVGVPRFDGDPNIGREWNSPAGRQRIISVEKWGGRDNYTVKTLETGGERIYDAPRLEESIKRDEYETTPEYAAEKAERKARAERQAAVEVGTGDVGVPADKVSILKKEVDAPSGEINYHVGIPKDAAYTLGLAGSWSQLDENGLFVLRSGYARNPKQALDALLWRLKDARSKVLMPTMDAQQEYMAKMEAVEAPVRTQLGELFRPLIKEPLNKELSARDAKGEPAIWLDDQIITPEGKYHFDSNGKLRKDQDLSKAGFEKNLDTIMSADGEGVLWGANKAAKAEIKRIQDERAAKKAAETQAAKEKAEKDAQEQVAKTAYAEAVDAIVLPKGKKQSIGIKDATGAVRQEESTVVGSLAYRENPTKGKDESPYLITHVPTGLSITGRSILSSLSDVTRFLKGMVLSGVDLSKPAFEESERAKMLEAIVAFRGGAVPSWFSPAKDFGSTKKSRALPKFTLPPQEPFKPTAERFAQFYRDYGIPEEAAVKNGAKLMEAIETGEWTKLLHPDNKRSRAIWEAWTRQKLPAGVKASEEAFAKYITEYHATSNPVGDLTEEELGRELLRLGPLALKPYASPATKARALALAQENQRRQEAATPAAKPPAQPGLANPPAGPSYEKVDAAVNAVKTSTTTAQAEAILNALTVDELKQVAKATNYPATGSKKDLIRRLLNAISFRAGARAIMGDAKVPNVPLIQRTPEQQREFEEKLRQEEEAAKAALAAAPKQAKPDKSQESFNRYMGAIFKNPPGPARQSAEEQAAELEEAAARLLEEEGEPMSEAEDKAEVAELMRQLQDESAREELRNDPEAIDAVRASGAMAGRNLSQVSTDPNVRAFFRALTAAREILGGPERVKYEEVRKWAKAQFDKSPAEAIAYATELADSQAMLDVEGQAVVAVVIEALNKEVAMTGDRDTRLLAQRLGNYFLDAGTRTAQALGARRDPLETPQDRWNKALSIVFGPREPARRRLRLAPSAAAKDRRIAELEAELEAAKAGQPVEGMDRARRPQDVQADIAREQAKETQEDIIAEEDAFNEEAKKDVLGNMGLTEQDVTLSAVDRYGVQQAILDIPSVREQLDRYNEGRDIMRLAFRGFSDRHIANALGLNETDVAKFIKDATASIIRPALTEEVKAGRGFGDILKSGLAKLGRAIGLQNPPGAKPLAQQGSKLTAAELAAVQAQVNTILNFAIQPAARRNKAGSLISKIITTPNGKKARIFVPFDPDDEASFYAFAREFSTRKAGTFDKLYEYWINWPLLSGPQTQVANITGNAAQLAWHFTGQRLAEAAINMAYGAVGKGDPNSAQIGEFGTLLGAFYSSMGPALEMAKRAFLTEADSVRHRYLNEPLQIDLLASGNVDKVGQYGPAVGGKLGRLNRLPGRLLKWTDAFFKTAILHTEVAALAYRKAHTEAKAAGLKGKDRKDYMRTEMANMLNDPSSQIWQDAMDTAEDLLFQKKNDITEAVETILGGKIQSENRFLQAYKKLMRFMVPFQRTPTNIIRTGIRKAGGAAIVGAYHFGRAGWLKYKNGTPMIESYSKAAQIKDISESVIAGLMATYLYAMLEGDDDDDQKKFLIVGNRPFGQATEAERTAFNERYGGPNSLVRLDGNGNVIWSRAFGRYEPIATTLSLLADAKRSWLEAKRKKAAGAEASYPLYLASSVFAGLEGKTFLQGVSAMMDTWRRFSERKTNPDQNWLPKAVLTSIMPNIIKQPLRNADDYVRDTKTAGIGYAALPNPEAVPKVLKSLLGESFFQAQQKISTMGEPIKKTGSPLIRQLFQMNTVVRPKPDAFLRRANLLNPAKPWYPAPLQRDDYTAKVLGQKEVQPITDPAKRKQFAEIIGQEQKKAMAAYEARLTPLQKAKPGIKELGGLKDAIEKARAIARAKAGIRGLQDPKKPATTTPAK